MPDPKPRFTGIFLPVEILEMEDLSPMEQILLAHIDSLYCSERGGCFASNEYLAKRVRVQENTIAKALTHLRALGLIEDVSFDGRNRVIRARIAEFVAHTQSNAALDLNPTQGWRKIQPCHGGKSNPIYKEESKEESKDYIPPTPKGGGSGVGSSPSSKIIRVDSKDPIRRVATTEQQHQSMLESHGEELVAQCYQELASWKSSATEAQIKKHTCDFRRINSWVVREVKKKDIEAKELAKREARLSQPSPYGKPNKFRAVDTGEYSDPAVWEENDKKNWARFRQEAAKAKEAKR